MQDTPTHPGEVLKKFMLEMFDYAALKKAGFYKGIKEKDYKAQAERVCKHFGYETVFEYGAKEIRYHATYAAGERPKYVNPDGKLIEEPFVSVIKNIYELLC